MMIEENTHNLDVIAVDISTCDFDTGWEGSSFFFKCNYNSKELVRCYSDGCDKLGFDPIGSYGTAAKCNKTIPSDKMEKLRQAGCDLFREDPVKIYPRGWTELFMWIAKYGDNSLIYINFNPTSVSLCNGDVFYNL